MQHRILQVEGGEHSDPLMPLLFSLAIHDPLAEAQRECGPQEHLFAFLDDVYATSVCQTARGHLQTQAGIRLHTGKTRVWNRASLCLHGWSSLGPEVWKPAGVKILGTLVGSQRFVEEVVDKRLAEKQRLWDAIPTVPDLQAEWQILLQCAGPRCHHIVRTLPPSCTPEDPIRGWSG